MFLSKQIFGKICFGKKTYLGRKKTKELFFGKIIIHFITRHFAWNPDNWENIDEIYSNIYLPT